MNKIVILLVVAIALGSMSGYFVHTYGQTILCYDRTILTVFQLNYVIPCLEDRIVMLENNPIGVTSLTSADTNTLTYNTSSGHVLTTPILKKLCEFTGVGGETSIGCTFSSSQQVSSIQIHYNSSVTNTVWVVRLNNDTSANYSQRVSINGGADSTTVGQVFLFTQTTTDNLQNAYFLDCHNHMPTMEKWCTGERMIMTSGVGAGSAPSRVELYGKWGNTANDITSINLTRTASTGTLNSSHIIVWGYS